jgi:Ca2+-binding RTX toxin-like protein
MKHMRLTVALAALVAGAIGVSSGTAARVPSHGLTASLNYGTLMVKGTQASEKIALRLRAGDSSVLEVDAGDDGSADFNFPRADIARIVVDARAGNDRIRIDDGNGAVEGKTPTILAGGDGRDTLAGGSGAETLLGGRGNDSIDGNAGTDTGLLGPGDDTFIWDPGDGSDKVEGQRGTDTMVFNGAAAAEQVDVSANGSRLRFFRNPGNITMDTAGVERVDFNALGGADLATVDDLTGTDVTSVNLDLGAADGQADRVVVNGTNGPDRIRVNQGAAGLTVTGLNAQVTIHNQEPSDALVVKGLNGNDDIAAPALPAQAIALTLDGGAGDDELFGGLGNDMLLGGDGNDTMDGSKGNDIALMDAGDDTFEWDPGDGSDVVEGGDGDDSMLFIGANVDEQIHVSANGNRVRFVRNVGNVTMDLAGLEQVDFQAVGGADMVDVGDLTGTDLTSLQADLGGADGAIDRVAVAGTDGDDAITVNGDAGGVKVSGLHTGVKILNPEFANDQLDVDTGAGRDNVDSSQLAPGTIQLFVDGAPVP